MKYKTCPKMQWNMQVNIVGVKLSEIGGAGRKEMRSIDVYEIKNRGTCDNWGCEE